MFIEETARAFLSRRETIRPERRVMRCAIRACVTCSPATSRRALTCKARPACSTAQVRAAHQQITSALIPPGEPGDRDWDHGRARMPASTWPRTLPPAANWTPWPATRVSS